MLLQIFLFLFGLLLVVWGADALVDGASSIARKFGISEFVIGLTIVGMGTSAPEMVVSFIGAIGGNADIAVGNVIGSNIFNTLLILGLTAMILPMNITYLNLKKDIPINIVITVLLLVLGMNFSIFGCGANRLSRVDGLVLLALFCLYMYMSFRFDTPNNNEGEPGETKKTGWAILLIVLGLNGLVVGGKLFVDSAVSIAKMLNVSDKFIAVTILAGGTSMPELATCLVAAVKKKGQLALGNIIGSNVFNILLILGGSALIHPLSLEQIGFVDLGILLLSSLVILTSAYIGKKNKIDRIDGIFFVLLEIAYMTWLIMEK
ncbi:MAG: calcium/sodium antiporter [Candidatus Cryptobacteroides sp.]|nr:calcium/sodium antiporter [Bacteroidales bacterium]MDY3963003.1 calcium/sodium antiporter [Candidatus Cryptobacteroides sp.]